MKHTLFLLTLAASITALAQDQKKAPPPPPLMMNIPALTDGAAAPVKFTCTNAPAGVSPAIEWKNAPAATQSFAVLLHDPEPRPGKSIYDVTHWFIWNIPATATGLPEGVPAGSDLPDGSHQLKRGNPATAGYYGPCAPPGPDHHYTFELYALDSKLDLSPDATRADAMKALDGHILAADVFVVLYHRP
ncbi:MAG: YbhB/YbcL family Raf kinase inhibitor-like protein [Bryobacteraceae bacterium]